MAFLANLRSTIAYQTTGSTISTGAIYTTIGGVPTWSNQLTYSTLTGSSIVSGNVGIGTNAPSQKLQVNGNIFIGPTYQQLSLTGGNSLGFLYGCYAKYNDGIHLGYNFYNDNTSNTIFNVSGATSRITMGYGFIGLYTGAVNTEPTTLGLYQNSVGRIGIGTNSPSNVLHVHNGNIRVTTGGNTGGAGGLIEFGVAAYPSYSAMANIGGDLQFTNEGGTQLQGGLKFNVTPYNGGATTTMINAMTIAANGNVGIGTNSPATTLHVNGIVTLGLINGTSTYPTGQGTIVVPTSYGVPYGTGGPPYQYGTSLLIKSGNLYSNVWGNTNNAGDIYLIAGDETDNGNNGTAGGTYNGGNLYFQSGRVAVSNSSGISSQTINGGSIIFQTGSTARNATATLGGYATVMTLVAGNVQLSNITTNGTMLTSNSNGTIVVSSDSRIKNSITYISDTSTALIQVNGLKPATFRMNDAPDIHFGFIAQDVEQFIPLAVDGKKHEYQWETTEDGKPQFDENGQIIYKVDIYGNKIIRPRGLSDRAIIAAQTLAIQELSKQTTSQKQEITALHATVAAQQTQFEQLLQRLAAAGIA